MSAGPSTQPGGDHYSYVHYADRENARAFDDRRFGGPIGELVAGTQARVLADMVGRIQDCDVLDVGTGTGRAALLLARSGARVTAIDASEEMLAIGRERAAHDLLSVRFLIGDAHALEFTDRSFDAVVCFRVLMHTPAWRQCLAEVCRVADRLVIIDYPSATSFAVVEALFRRAFHAMGGRTEPYRVLTHAAIVDALRRNGFNVRSVHRQVVLPIAFHKLFGSRRLTIRVEHVLDGLGLLERFGSPVTLVADRS